MLQIAAETLDELDVRAAVAEEIRRPRVALPRQALEAALAGHEDELAEYLKGQYSRGLEVFGVDEIQAVKSGHALRPLSILSFHERVLYEALTVHASRSTPSLSRQFADWDSFAAAPVAEGPAYVVNADIAAFYQYVDHDLLETELVNQTGDASTASLIASFLHGVMQRRFGLPQLYRGSDVLSELVIDIVERRLIRGGWRVWRYNDDFRIAVDSWAQTMEAIEALDREARAVGLSLNDEKTYPLKLSTYTQWLGASDSAWDEISETVEFDFRAYSPPYSDDEDEDGEEAEEEPAEEDPALVEAAAIRALEFWNELPQRSPEEEAIPGRVYRRLLSQALLALSRIESSQGLWAVPRILAMEPQFVPSVARYLAIAARDDAQGVNEVFDALIVQDGVYLNSWQRLWLLSSTTALGTLSPALGAWVRECMDEPRPGVLRSRAALTLSWYGMVSPDEVVRVFEQIPKASRPDSIVALTNIVGKTDQRVRAIASESPINRWIVEWASGES